MFWAACNLTFFRFLRSAEFTVPNLASFSPSIHLGLDDVAVDSMSSPSCLRLRIKASKTDPFRKGIFLHIGRGEFPLCAIRSLLAYLTLRGNAPGPLFLFRDGRPLTRALLTSWLRDILSSAGIQGNFSSHSFRIGAATVAARNGIPDHQIQALGRWTSSAYLSYICLSCWGLGIGAWRVVGFWPLFHPVHGPFFLQAPWRERFGGCRSQDCHGYPTRLARFHSWPHPPF